MPSMDSVIKSLNLSVTQEVFNSHYRYATIDSVALEDIPFSAMQVFEGYSKRFILPKDYHQGNFDSAFLISHDGGEKTYVVTQPKTYHTGSTERLAYVADVDDNDVLMSHAELRFSNASNDAFFKDKPFSGFNGCDNDMYMDDEALTPIWVSQGVRQLTMMNALSHALHGLPLHSDTLLTTFEKPLWEKLDMDEMVMRYKEGKHRRYVFNPTPIFYKHNLN